MKDIINRKIIFQIKILSNIIVVVTRVLDFKFFEKSN